MRIFILITFVNVILSSENTGLRIDLNIEVPLLENQYVIFNASQVQIGATTEILPTYKLLANLKNNSLGIYSQMFDFLTYSDFQQIGCYQQNVVVLTDVYSCTQSCNSTASNFQLGVRGVAQLIENDQYYVIDNTQLPCVEGTFFKLLVPWITVQALFQFKDSSYLVGTIIIVLLVTIITIQIMSIIVLYYKLRKYKKKIKKTQDKHVVKRNMIMRSDYQELTEDQSISLQEIKSQSQASNYYKN